ncbi:MAG: WbqC family protein [Dysgonamonadaceae bacterium]|jgi:hypothetical protein|nr:WbqC family protein [Dysgonamonadaceae bacterium]
MLSGQTVILSSAYLAPVEYYIQMSNSVRIVIEKEDNYIKQTYRNRCIIATANGIQTLSIPVIKPDARKCLTRDIRIAEHGNWRHLHWNAIVSSYNSTPFFEYYADAFRPFYEKPQGFLFDFNEALRELVCSLLDISPSVSYSNEYIIPSEKNSDFRDVIHPKKEACIKDLKPYYQVFENKFGFRANLSIIDLLFNMGPESALYLNF